jgi:hypothetical protein
MLQLIGLVGGVIAIGGAIYFLYVRLGECRSAKASVKWPSASGQITASSTRKYFDLLRPAFVPLVEYVFKASGQDQTGRRVA